VTDEGECGTQESVVLACCLNACWRVLLDGKEAVKDTKVMGRERKHIIIIKTYHHQGLVKSSHSLSSASAYYSWPLKILHFIIIGNNGA